MAVQECLRMLCNKWPMKVVRVHLSVHHPFSTVSLQKIVYSYMPGKQELKRKL